MSKYTLALFIALTSNCIAQSFEDYKNHIEASEGKRLTKYIDSHGNATIGIGHKLIKGENYTYITERECNMLFTRDLERAKAIAKRVFPSFDTQPHKVKLILVSLCFNMGEGGINKFVRFKTAIHNKDYKLASLELKQSRWFTQTGNRGVKYTNILKRI